MAENFNRKEFLNILRQKPDLASSQLDDLDKMAIGGYQYLDHGSNADEALQSIDDRFESWIKEQSVSAHIPAKKTSRIFNLWRLAAAILLLLIPAYFLFRPLDDSRLVQVYFEAPPSPYIPVLRGDASPNLVDPSLQEAFLLYEKQDFIEAARAIRLVRGAHPEKADLVFYEGIALLGAGKTLESIELLETCINSPEQLVSARTPWYLALAYLQNNDRASAIPMLRKAQEMDDINKSSAAELLEKLD